MNNSTDFTIEKNQHQQAKKQVFTNIGKELYKNGRFREAIDNYNKALEYDPCYKPAYYNKGLAQQSCDQLQEAIECYDKAIQLDQMFIDAYQNKGIALRKLGLFAEAICNYNKIIGIDSKCSEAFYNKGISLNELGQHALAIDCYNKAISLNPKYKQAFNCKGNSLSSQKRYEEAIKNYNEVIRIDSNYKQAYYNKGLAFSNLFQHSNAVECFNKAIQIDHKYMDAYYSKGIALKHLGQYQEAITNFNKYLELNPQNSDAYYAKGNIFRQLLEYNEAIESYSCAININQCQPLFYVNRAKAYLKQSSQQNAVSDIKQAAKLLQEGYCKGLSSANIKYIQSSIQQLNEVEQKGQQLLLKTDLLEVNMNEKDQLQKSALKYVSALKEKTQMETILLVSTIIEVNEENNVNSQPPQFMTQVKKQQDLFERNLSSFNQQILNMSQMLNSKEKKGVQQLQLLFENKFIELSEQVNALKKELANQQNEFKIIQNNVIKINNDLQDGGCAEKAYLNRELFKLQNEGGKEVIHYFKTFYWTTLNMLQTYRILSTGMIKFNYQSNITSAIEENKELIQEGMKAGLQVGRDICKEVIKAVPIIGNVFCFIDSIINNIVTLSILNKNRNEKILFENRVQHINKVIQSKFRSEEEISIKLAKAALGLSELRKIMIHNSQTIQKEREEPQSWLSDQLTLIADKFIEKQDLNDKNSYAVQLALKDSTLLISYICEYSSQIVMLEEDIEDIIIDLVKQKKTDELLISISSESSSQSSNNCQICCIF